ncbi:MAG: glycoside hydrolase family 9 protein [Cyclobacteriaceae bacterium]
MKSLTSKILTLINFFVFTLFCLSSCSDKQASNTIQLNDKDYFDSQGFDVFVFSSLYGLFGDEKKSSIELIHHDVRTATNGDVRLGPTPEQWDAIPNFIERKVDRDNGAIEAFLEYPDYDFQYSVKVISLDETIRISVNLKETLPAELEGRAGFNMEFLPPAYFEKSYLMDEKPGQFPLYPNSEMEVKSNGVIDPLPLATGNQVTLSPEDPRTKIQIRSDQTLALYDGRNKAQNGWFVVRSLIPSGKTGAVVEWTIAANTIPGWVREPVICHSQQGYHPEQVKRAVIELDERDSKTKEVQLLKISADGEEVVKSSPIAEWGNYLRYKYGTFDFTEITEEGIYHLKAGEVKTASFSIGSDVYETAWQPTLDIYLPVQMDHILVNEAYRVWHGKSHMDDALQAPINHEHFDLYAMGATTDTQFQGGEHIPGLNYGGWYDAGDFDIRTQTQCYVVQNLVNTWEDFGVNRDQTLVDYEAGYVDMHVPDGKPDLLQQIEHGALGLIAQHRAVGHAIHGIVAAHISQYTHLGDGVTKTDNLIYSPSIDSFQTDGYRSGLFDDRWAFTTRSTPLNYYSASALAAASRALKGYNDELADECLQTALRVWDEEGAKEPDLFHHGNTTGGALEDEQLKAAIQLLITTGNQKYSGFIESSWERIDLRFNQHASAIVPILDQLSEEFQSSFRSRVEMHKSWMDSLLVENPYGVPITTGGWAGSSTVTGFGLTAYQLHKAFPELIGKEYALRALEYLYGNHPGSDISLVSGVGTKSKKVAYGNNRADYSFIAGGVVPGVLIIAPDFPENKEDWPFLWGENEYVVSGASSYLYLTLAANDLLNAQ